ncbi:MAG: hypothetical protein FOGNACKC_05482 [Anaerolineae bacterium]|nr:hypothetical protein [Anaerolineae bacterium]
MSDILQVLDQQTSQTETLIARLQQRLEQTSQLRQLEQQRQQLVDSIARLESRLAGIDEELVDLRRLAATDADLAGATTRLQTAWAGLAPAQPPSGLPVAPAALNEEPEPDHLTAPALFDAEPVLDTGSFTELFGGSEPDNDAGWSFDGGLFSAAEELKDPEAPDEWAWWGSDQNPAAAGNEAPADDFLPGGLYDAGEALFEAPLLPEPETAPGRKGLLARFF